MVYRSPNQSLGGDILVRKVRSSDSGQITRLYNHYIRHSTATFEEEALQGDEMLSRIALQRSKGLPWLVCEQDGEILGYAYAGPFRKRAAYRFTLESAVYVDPKQTGKGIGRALYDALLSELSTHSECRMLMGVITIPNEPSIRLHENLGFEKVGVMREVGYKFGQWIDVGIWQLQLRRSEA